MTAKLIRYIRFSLYNFLEIAVLLRVILPNLQAPYKMILDSA